MAVHEQVQTAPPKAVPEPEAARRLMASAARRRRLNRPGARIVLLADAMPPSRTAGVAGWLRALPSGSVTVLAAEEAPGWGLGERRGQFAQARTLAACDHHLKRHGPVDAIIDLRRVSFAAHVKGWRALFYHLAPGGVYALDPHLGGFAARGPRCTRWTAELSAMKSAADPLPSPAARELARALGAVRVFPRLVMIENRLRHQLKLRDSGADEVLATREPGLAVSVERTLPAGRFESAGSIMTHTASVPIDNISGRIEYPSLHLRHYVGSINLVSNSLLHTRDTILPDSFRHHLQRDLTNPRLLYCSRDFGRVPAKFAARRTLQGTYFNLDSENSGHFGHLMTEVISRLWAWDDAKTRHPDLRAIMRIRFPGEREPDLERQIFRAYGISDDELVVLDEPATLESVVAATPMWHNHVPHYVHPDITLVWKRITEALADFSLPDRPKLFVSRQGHQKNRRCRNAEAVEEYFAAAGFDVVYPEMYSLAQQAGMFARARVVAGFGGSGMFNVLHCRSLRKMILLSHEAYTARNEHLFASALGADVHYFWSTPDVPHPSGGWREEAFYSDWEFDFQRNRAALDALTAEL